jgi:hypothetical protein
MCDGERRAAWRATSRERRRDGGRGGWGRESASPASRRSQALPASPSCTRRRPEHRSCTRHCRCSVGVELSTTAAANAAVIVDVTKAAIAAEAHLATASRALSECLLHPRPSKRVPVVPTVDNDEDDGSGSDGRDGSWAPPASGGRSLGGEEEEEEVEEVEDGAADGWAPKKRRDCSMERRAVAVIRAKICKVRCPHWGDGAGGAAGSLRGGVAPTPYSSARRALTPRRRAPLPARPPSIPGPCFFPPRSNPPFCSSKPTSRRRPSRRARSLRSAPPSSPSAP